MPPTLGSAGREFDLEDEIVGTVEWTAQDIAEVEHFRLSTTRGGYDPESVDLLIGNAVACMRAGRPLPDPTAFALPKNRLRPGYSPADTNRLLDLLQRRRVEWADRSAASPAESEGTEPAPSRSSAPPAHRWTQSQIDWVRDRRFATRRGGYDRTDVDDFLDDVIVAMAHGQRLPDVKSALFGQSGLKHGYDFVEVDTFLDELAALQPGRG